MFGENQDSKALAAPTLPQVHLEKEIPVIEPKVEPESDTEIKAKRKPGRPKKTEIDLKALADIKIPMAKLVKQITGMIADARNDPRCVATDEEQQDIDKGFDLWVSYRAPVIMSAKPELALGLPILMYALRIATLKPLPQEKAK